MQHLAMIMDGNRRWAKENGISAVYGEESKRSVRLAMEFCIKKSIKYLSLYAFSLENFNRSQTEKKLIFKLMLEVLVAELPELIKQGIKICFVGDRTVFPKNVLPAIEGAEKKTAHLDKLTVNILFCYGGKQELASAVKAIAKKVQDGELDINEITEDTIQDSLWTAGTPNPELIVRTSGTMRLSNFLTYQSAYSELAFLKCHWPELTEDHLEKCTRDFLDTKRNFGA